mmetsp:Transcript_40564/g.92511  ORF Transcript_40564/g.92511 Transcript_40564/m.92511 type:complete len:281 (-) Transcript_40564:41-883(-)
MAGVYRRGAGAAPRKQLLRGEQRLRGQLLHGPGHTFARGTTFGRRYAWRAPVAGVIRIALPFGTGRLQAGRDITAAFPLARLFAVPRRALPLARIFTVPRRALPLHTPFCGRGRGGDRQAPGGVSRGRRILPGLSRGGRRAGAGARRGSVHRDWSNFDRFLDAGVDEGWVVLLDGDPLSDGAQPDDLPPSGDNQVDVFKPRRSQLGPPWEGGEGGPFLSLSLSVSLSLSLSRSLSHRVALGIGLLQGPRRVRLLLHEVPLYPRLVPTPYSPPPTCRATGA